MVGEILDVLVAQLDDRPVSPRVVEAPATAKADSLTSRGLCVAAIDGVFNWRSRHGTLGDWEDIPLKGRRVVICFDSDARTNPNVARAMVRLGRWLKSKGVKRVVYLIVPAEVDGTAVKGVDDFLVAGGTLDQLREASSTREPNPELKTDTFTDARLAETIADDLLAGQFLWSAGLGWLSWDGARWRGCSDVTVIEAVRQYCLDRYREAVDALGRDPGGAAKIEVDGWHGLLSAGRERTVTGLARGIVEVDAASFDAHSDLLNTPTGVVDLRTGELGQSDPDLLLTKVTGVGYHPEALTGDDWEAGRDDWHKALEAIPSDVREWLQIRYGQAITGYMTPDDMLPIQQGGGENGKTTITAGISGALGDYYLLLSDRVILANPR